MQNVDYEFFKTGLLRIPFFPFNYLQLIDKLDSILSLQAFKEAIYIASPSLFEEVYIKKNRSEKVILSLLKYYIRACTRCTPYGLFAGCTTVKMGYNSQIEIQPETECKTYSRIDMEYLCDIIRTLEEDTAIKQKLRYHVNTTLYYAFKSVRYIKYIVSNYKRQYTFIEIELSEYLDIIIQSASKHPQTIDSLANKIISSDITLEDAKIFVNELIEEQILISELEPSVAGEDLIYQIIHKLNNIHCHNTTIGNAQSLLSQCDDATIGNHIELYEKILPLLRNQCFFSGKNWLHVDCKFATKSNIIGKEIYETVKNGIFALERLSPWEEDEVLKSFKDAFYKRYEEQEIPLFTALDPQTGIGFGPWGELQGDTYPLISDLAIGSKPKTQSFSVKISPLTKMLIQKYENCLKNNLNTIDITDDDLKSFEKIDVECSSNLLYVIARVIDLNGKESPTIYMEGAYGTSAANLLSRFEYLDNDIKELVNEITKREEEFYPDKIVAEIAHLPEDRIGNIQMHPQNRKYEIDYMSNPHYSSSEVVSIGVEDILISVPLGKRVILRSKKYNKIIIPRLTTAHNFRNGLPIYYFLSTVQHQDERSLHFSWGNYFESKFFLPRVTYKNIILSSARWYFKYSDLPDSKNQSFEKFYEDFTRWRKLKNIPNIVQIVEFDNKLMIDFTNILTTKLFIDNLKKKGICILEECLFQDVKDPLVRREDNYFTNELILCLSKTRLS